MCTLQVGILSWYDWCKLDSNGREEHLIKLVATLTVEADAAWALEDANSGPYESNLLLGGVATNTDAVAAAYENGMNVTDSRGVAVTRGSIRASPTIQQTPAQ